MRHSAMHHAAAGLLLGALVSVLPGTASARTYSESEFKCVALALWYERGSTTGLALEQNKEGVRQELRLMVHSIKVRGSATHWYNRRDWGGPNLCDVIKKKVGNVCQYSYKCTPAAREKKPVSGDLWTRIKQTVADSAAAIKEKAADVHDAIKRNITERDKWEECVDAARDVLNDGHPWQPPEQYVLTDTFQHECSEPKYYTDACDKRVVSGPSSKCYFALEEILLENGPLPLKRNHAFYRRVTIGEVRAQIQQEPPKICEGLRTLEVVQQAWREWIAWEDKKIENPDLQEPQFKKKESKNKHVGHRGKSKKNKSRHRRGR